MNHASLFSGIGGFDLAAEWMGWNNVFNCEWEEFPRQVLKHHFPNAKQYGDIRELRATAYAGRIDILTGGFPCQPYSLAGKRKGKEDERNLWPEMLRVIRECTPSYVVGENVLGLVNWNDGLVFEEVCAELESEGYEVQPFVLPAAGVNAPHRRNRVWFVAHSDERNGRRTTKEYKRESQEERLLERNKVHESIEPSEVWGDASNNNERNRKEERFQTRREINVDSTMGNSITSDTSGTELQGSFELGGFRSERKAKDKSRQSCRPICDQWQDFPTESPICGGNDGLSRQLDGITFSKWRNESIKAYGNAIVPQVALQIFKAIQQYELERAKSMRASSS